MNQSMTDLLDRFVEYSKVQNYSPRTVQHRNDYISVFIAWAEQRGLSSPNEVTKPVLERYRAFLHHYRKRNGDPPEHPQPGHPVDPVAGLVQVDGEEQPHALQPGVGA